MDEPNTNTEVKPVDEVPVSIDEMSDDQIANFDMEQIETIPEPVVTDDTEPEPNTEPEPVNPDEPVYEPNLELLDAFKDPITMKGVEITINTPQELRRLVQQGLGASKRMQDLKPQLKLMDMLEANELMDADKLNYLIDLSKGDETAIKKLVSEHKIDTLSFGDEEVQYTPNNHQISDAQHSLKQVIGEVQHMSEYADTLDTVKSMDDKSKIMIGEQPERLGRLVHDHQSGVYSEIRDIVIQEQAKGVYTDLSFMEAYETVVQVINDNNANAGMQEQANNNNQARSTNSESTNTQPHEANALQANSGSGQNVDVAPQYRNNSLSDTSNAAKQASNATTKPVASGTGSEDVFDLSKMSDAEISSLDFIKLFGDN